MSTIVKERSDIDEKYTWRLTDIFDSDDSWEESVRSLSGNEALIKVALVTTPETPKPMSSARS